MEPFREDVLNQPAINVATTAELLLAVLGAAAIDVVNGKEMNLCLATARALRRFAAVMFQARHAVFKPPRLSDAYEVFSMCCVIGFVPR